MWKLFGKKQIAYGKLGEASWETSLRLSSDCFATAQAAQQVSEIQFRVLMWQTLAFLMSTIIHQIMVEEQVAQKEDFDRIYNSLGRSVGNARIRKSIPGAECVKGLDIFALTVLPTDDQFKRDTLFYLMGNFSSQRNRCILPVIA